jgi:DNA mismatch repair protein MutL
MKPIIQLDGPLINKISAGEVVERPLSVVKELTENALDAGAGLITVEIRGGGLDYIRVTDNGSGIPGGQLPLAFARHATSKITSAEDLFGVRTLGFRGEALCSIAAVSRVEIITKTAEALTGTRAEIHGGQLMANGPVGCVNGTTLVVSDLFYNTPARRKFLKKPAIEAGYVADCMQRLALSHPGVTFRFINNGQVLMQTNGSGDVKTVMLQLYGRETASKLAAVKARDGALALEGYIGKPETARGNRGYGNFFVNGRCIQSRLLQRAVEGAMKTMLPLGRFPVYALGLTLPVDGLDVNVHPTKMDVRFENEEAVYAFVESSVYGALADDNLIPQARLVRKAAERETEKEEPERFYPSRQSPTRVADTDFITAERIYPSPQAPREEPLTLLEEAPPPTGRGSLFTNYTVHGLLFSTYWLVSQGDSLFLIDQHAAHERKPCASWQRNRPSPSPSSRRNLCV